MDVGAVVIPAVTAVVGALAGAGANAGLETRRRRQDAAERKRKEQADAEAGERLRLGEFQTLLRRSRRLYVAQAEKRDQLVTELKRNHPDFKLSRKGFEYWFRDAHPAMTEEELQVHRMILGYTVDEILSANRDLQAWIATNHDLAAGDGPFAQQLSQLQRHLEGWFVKYNQVFLSEPGRALVYLADEDNLGPGFPQDLDAFVELAYAQAAATASAES